eukprot:Pompholyxophrys_punicea_v1_NODE_485_length_1857_cov_54.259711.p3 type:complete len:105 gc:universal NODE_485_length_1857_cov_54.259711:792-1106(+)
MEPLGQSIYHQKFSVQQDSFKPDVSLFATSLVPPVLEDVNATHRFWTNPVLGSSRFCRPIHLNFQKEDVDLSKNAEDFIKNQIQSLLPFEIIRGSEKFLINITN